MLEIFNNLFRAIAEQMGVTLQNTSYSVNIKERLDFSCAIFDRHGELVANAPHIPVHLGSMGESVKAVIASLAVQMIVMLIRLNNCNRAMFMPPTTPTTAAPTYQISL
jgi:N-methylhydantoinase B/oxoprolinase/acetone carboxylase alpha subunit